MMSPIQEAINCGRKDKQIASAPGLTWPVLFRLKPRWTDCG